MNAAITLQNNYNINGKLIMSKENVCCVSEAQLNKQVQIRREREGLRLEG